MNKRVPCEYSECWNYDDEYTSDFCWECKRCLLEREDNYYVIPEDTRTEEEKAEAKRKSDEELARTKEIEAEMIESGKLKPPRGISDVIMNGIAATFEKFSREGMFTYGERKE